MASKAIKIVDGSRRRCLGCGHPRVEHRPSLECTVPQCPCEAYMSPVASGTKS